MFSELPNESRDIFMTFKLFKVIDTMFILYFISIQRICQKKCPTFPQMKALKLKHML